MKTKITFMEDVFGSLQAALKWDGKERAAWVLAHSSMSEHGIKLLPYNVIVPQESDYVSRSSGYYELRKSYINRAVNSAIGDQTHVIQCHIHPAGVETFSPVDEERELELMRHIAEKVSRIVHASVLFSNDGRCVDSWFYDRENDQLEQTQKVVVVRSDGLDVIAPEGRDVTHAALDRTRMAIGDDVVAKLSQLDFGVVGASALGAPVIEFLARDRVGSIFVCDPDEIDITNLNRLPGTTANDVGKLKASFYGDLARRVSPETCVSSFAKSFYEKDVQSAFSWVDVMFGCVDSGARHSINRLSMANSIPYFDLGAGIHVGDDGPEFIGGQVFNVIPGGGMCLSCSGEFDALYEEYLAPADRQREIDAGYIQGNGGQVIPLIMSLDYVISGIGYGQMLKFVAGMDKVIPGKVSYSALDNRLRATEYENGGCMMCKGFLGQGHNVDFMIPRKENNPELNP
jgi:molybdopterin/thiamine biosynthesis adenylyltransferase